MRIRTILAAAAAPAALAAVLLGTAGQASAATVPVPSTSAYFYNPSGNALGGPQPMPSGSVSFGSSYLAKVTEKTNNMDLRGKTITITGHVNSNNVSFRPNGGPTPPTARLYFLGASGGVSDGSPDGYMGQSWWANVQADPSRSSFVLNQNGDFSVTLKVDYQAGWSDWNGQFASDNQTLFEGAASHVQQVGLSFGGGSFFENGVTGNGSLHIDSIKVDGSAV
jgi:hypothetical protein